jgi:hypothetical protein
MSNVAINIAAEFTGKAAFKQATTAAQRLEKQVAKLGRGIGISLGTVAIGRFAKTSLNAFVADEAAATKLTVAVKNLGLEFANPYITDYISNLERTTKVADDELRPAFQRLLQQTGSIAQSQSILNTAIEVSRGSTESLSTVSEDLAKAYYGQTRSLRKYSLGLTQAQLETKDFAELQDILNSKFTGSSAAYLTSYAGQLGIVSLAWNNLQENAGKALFTLAGASGDQSSGARRLGFLIDAFGLGLVEMADTLKKAVAAFGQAYLGFSTPRENQTAPAAPTGQELFRQSMANDAKLKEIEARQAKLYKQQMTTLKKMTDEQKKQAALKKAGTVFDIDQIQILAALRRDVSETDRKRLEAQAAILNGNADLATKLTKDILMAQDKTGGLYQYFLSIGDAKIKNPFAFLDEWIIKFQEKLNSLKFPTTTPAASTGTGGGGSTSGSGTSASFGGSSSGGSGPSTGSYQPYADGGLITRPTRALIGEAGAEAVVPLTHTGENSATAISRIILANMPQAQRSGGDVVIKIGEREFARVAIDSINNYQNAVGRTLLEV